MMMCKFIQSVICLLIIGCSEPSSENKEVLEKKILQIDVFKIPDNSKLLESSDAEVRSGLYYEWYFKTKSKFEPPNHEGLLVIDTMEQNTAIRLVNVQETINLEKKDVMKYGAFSWDSKVSDFSYYLTYVTSNKGVTYFRIQRYPEK